MQLLFAGTTKEDPTTLISVIKFDSVEAIQAFGSHEEFTETRRQAGMIMESGVMTPISDEFFNKLPRAFHTALTQLRSQRIPQKKGREKSHGRV